MAIPRSIPLTDSRVALQPLQNGCCLEVCEAKEGVDARRDGIALLCVWLYARGLRIVAATLPRVKRIASRQRGRSMKPTLRLHLRRAREIALLHWHALAPAHRYEQTCTRCC